MILAAGLSPAWQHTLVFARLESGQVNRALETYHCASGKSVNVALALTALGAPVRLLTTSGGATGRLLADDCRREAIDCRFVETQRATRECTTLIDRSSGCVTELVENVPPLSPGEVADAEAAYRSAIERVAAVVLSGSLPAGALPGLIGAWASQAACPVLLDVRGDELWQALAARPWVVKPNRAELAATLGRELASDADVFAAAAELQQRGARNVVVTHGAGPLLALDETGRRLSLTPPAIEVQNPIGSGDCLAAGLAFEAARGQSLGEALPRAMALAAENCRGLLPARLGKNGG